MSIASHRLVSGKMTASTVVEDAIARMMLSNIGIGIEKPILAAGRGFSLRRQISSVSSGTPMRPVVEPN